MLRITVYTGSDTLSQRIFTYLQDTVRGIATRCELTFVKDASVIYGKLDTSLSYYDVFVLDSQNAEARKIADRVRKGNLVSSFIFLTERSLDAVLEAVSHRPSRFVVDREDMEGIANAVRQCCKEQLAHRPYFNVKTKESVMRVSYANINYFESDKRKVILHTGKQIIEFYAKLGDVIELLPQDQFVRCHQSFIINLAKIRSLDKVNRTIEMQSGIMLEISKSQYSSTVARYEEYLERN